jgi:signal transduction histidine kinase
MRHTDPGARSFPALQISALLLLLVVVIDVLAVVGIVRSRREARLAAVEELQRRAQVQARGCEAALATLRADLLFLAGSPRLVESWQRRRSADPLAERWARLELESTLLQFLEGHPGLVALELGSEEEQVQVARSETGAPVIASASGPREGWTLELALEVAGDGLELHAVVDPARLLEAVSPGLGGALVIELDDAGASEELAVLEPVNTRGWQTPAPVSLERREGAGRLFGAVETLASRYRTTVLLNAVVFLLALPLALLAVREARRAERLAAAHEHERERRRMERQVWHQERLATVGRLAADLAHEINNPLAGVSNHLVLLEEDLAAGEVDGARRRLPRLRQGIDRMAATVRGALQLARPGRIEREILDLRAVVGESVALLRGRMPAVEVRVLAGSGDPILVEGDAAALAQLVTNLVLNAMQVQESGGEVEVRVGRGDGEARLEVLDRGPGIPAEIAEHLFEPFVSGRGSTGLGLSVCHGIVRHHEGRVIAANRPDGGARFVVDLPLAAVREAS